MVRVLFFQIYIYFCLISAEASSNETRTSNTSSQQTQNGNPSNVFIGAFQGSGDEMNNVTQVSFKSTEYKFQTLKQ